ncbi:MAG: hypothetical protein NUW21_10660 [Elusimicrobia bacterium]|nr:hypothetical protein [Elusimicrobiota bacterium]
MSLMSAVSEQSWTIFRKLVQERFPHGKAYGVKVVGGVVVSFERVQYTRNFSAQPAGRQSQDANDQWCRFMLFCWEAGNAVLPEVHFRDGNPYLAQLEEPGGLLIPT